MADGIKRRVLTLLVCLALLCTGVMVMRAEEQQGFTIVGTKPVLDHGDKGSWYETYVDPGAVAYYNGKFHMFYNGFNGWPASVQIGYATSPDGVTWTKQGAEPVLKTDQVSYAGVAALASSLIVEDNKWILYFYTWETNGTPLTAKGRIGRATAPDPAGPWTAEGSVLEPGKAGSWDDLRVDTPSVIRTKAEYVMFYSGVNSKGEQMIGRATSPDGIKWTKHNDPVLMPGMAGTWDAPRVQQPRVVLTPDGWVMVYRSVKVGTPSTIALGYATSADGIQWQRFGMNPIVEAPKVFGKAGFWFTGLAYCDNTYYLYIEAQPGVQSETVIFVATHKGSLIAR